MSEPQVFFREAGSGPGVVCVHSNASTSSQWRSLIDHLAPHYHVLAPDSYGSGKSPDWPSPDVIRLRDEVALIEPMLDRAGAPLALVGHSYGAAVALLAALAQPSRIAALVLYEPTLFSLIEAQAPAPNEADGIRNAVADAAAALDRGDRDAAAGHFIDYWMGAGSWRATPEARKPAIAESVRKVRRWAHALMTEPTPAAAFASLRMPILYLLGERSPVSAHAVARRLLPVLPRAQVVRFAGLGHMAPITHADRVNTEIANFLDRHHRP